MELPVIVGLLMAMGNGEEVVLLKRLPNNLETYWQVAGSEATREG